MKTLLTRVSPTAIAIHTGIASLALLLPSPATAAESEAAESAEASVGTDFGDVIVVTARRREETSQDVPIALSVVNADTLERTGQFTLNQIQQLVPSLQIASFNPRNSNINLRGLGANSSIAVDGLEYGVGFYVDGVFYGRPGLSQFDLIDIAQIEVLRGPQGTLFGKNTIAGAINVTTREPSFDPELTVEGTIGNYQHHQIRASASAPIIADKVAVRLTIADTHRKGFLTNRFDGSDAQNYDNFTARGQLLITPDETLKIRIIGDYSRQKQHFALTLIDDYFTSFANGAPIPNSIFDRAARTGYNLPEGGIFQRFGYADSRFQANMDGYGVSGQIDWDLGGATLTSITAHRWWDWYPANDVDATSLPINTKAQQENYQRQFTQELRIASNGENTLNYVAGLFYFWQKIRGYGETGYGSDFAEWNLNPATTPAANIALIDLALSDFETGSYSDPQTKSYAAFGQIDWRVSDALTLTGGLRYTRENKEGIFRRFWLPGTGVDPSTLTPQLAAAVLALRSGSAFQTNEFEFSASTKEGALSGQATISYKVAPDVLAYGTYSQGEKSGGLNLTAGGASRPVVSPEKVTAYEIGFKSQWLNRRLTVNAAAFLTEITDYQATVSEQVPGSTQFTQYIDNIPKVRSKGIEADVSYAPSRWFGLTASAAYTDARYVSFPNSPQAPERVNEGPVQDLSGQRLPGVSKFAYTIALDLAQPVSDTLEVYGRADWLHRSSYNASSTNSSYSVIPAYGVLNARIGLRTGNSIDLSVWARNLLDEDYYANRVAGTFGLITGSAGDPRTFGGTLRVKW